MIWCGTRILYTYVLSICILFVGYMIWYVFQYIWTTEPCLDLKGSAQLFFEVRQEDGKVVFEMLSMLGERFRQAISAYFDGFPWRNRRFRPVFGCFWMIFARFLGLFRVNALLGWAAPHGLHPAGAHRCRAAPARHLERGRAAGDLPLRAARCPRNSNIRFIDCIIEHIYEHINIHHILIEQVLRLYV